jgi:hypothetical protein
LRLGVLARDQKKIKIMNLIKKIPLALLLAALTVAVTIVVTR